MGRNAPELPEPLRHKQLPTPEELRQRAAEIKRQEERERAERAAAEIPEWVADSVTRIARQLDEHCVSYAANNAPARTKVAVVCAPSQAAVRVLDAILRQNGWMIRSSDNDIVRAYSVVVDLWIEEIPGFVRRSQALPIPASPQDIDTSTLPRVSQEQLDNALDKVRIPEPRKLSTRIGRWLRERLRLARS